LLVPPRMNTAGIFSCFINALRYGFVIPAEAGIPFPHPGGR